MTSLNVIEVKNNIENVWKKCWDANPEFFIVLKESLSPETARGRLKSILDSIDWSYKSDYENIPSWHYFLLKEATKTFENIIALRNEKLANFSALTALWEAAHGKNPDVSINFIMEFAHLFKAVKGLSELYPSFLLRGIEKPNFDWYYGREAGVLRSDYLDKMADKMEDYVRRYPSGMQKEIIEFRRHQKLRILDIFDSSIDDWNDWKWQYKHVFRKVGDLEKIEQIIHLSEEEEEAIKLALENKIPFGITPHYLHLMDIDSKHDFAIRRQVIPPISYVEAMIQHKDDRDIVFDFMREHDTSPVDLVTRRYPRVAILKPYDSCPQICVYCQRNWEIKSPFQENALASKEKLHEALNWFKDHKNIMDVLITGGDPLIMNDRQIEHIIQRLSELDHIRNIRLATRIPVTVPQRITSAFSEMVKSYIELGKRSICMVTHFEHPYEITFDTSKAVERLKHAGLSVYNQQVFTFANSRRFETVALRIALKTVGIDPYYTFNMKGKEEISDYAVPTARLIQERKEEARLLPGIFRTDEPVFNVPLLGKNHLRAWQDHELIAVLADGRRMYSFHPWEKNLDKVKPYLSVDVPIYEYLEKLKARGENIDEYNSIWYYY